MMRETDLYLPVKSFLEAQGYEVKAEVCDCDIVGIRDDETPVIVELKLSLNLKVILQCLKRIDVSDKVYVGVPWNCSSLNNDFKMISKLFKMLGLGLLTVDGKKNQGKVLVLIDPCTYRPRKNKRRKERLLGEFFKRVGDPNMGGETKRRGLMTAYRQRALRVADFLEKNGPTKASEVAKAIKESSSLKILYRDVYGWFDRISYGVYDLSPRGRREKSYWEGKER